MHWTIHIDPNVNCAFVKYYGAFDISQLKNSAEEMFSHPDYRVGMNALRDASNQTIPSDVSFKSLSNEARGTMNEFDHKLAKCKWAIVVGNVQSYAKVHQALVAGRIGDNPVHRKAFRDIEKAKEWLGIPEGYEIKYLATGETT